jgi:hypothetical protein
MEAHRIDGSETLGGENTPRKRSPQKRRKRSVRHNLLEYPHLDDAVFLVETGRRDLKQRDQLSHSVLTLA